MGLRCQSAVNRCDQIEGPKNSTHGQKIALTAILDEENNFTTRVMAKPAILLIPLNAFFNAIARLPSHPREGGGR